MVNPFLHRVFEVGSFVSLPRTRFTCLGLLCIGSSSLTWSCRYQVQDPVNGCVALFFAKFQTPKPRSRWDNAMLLRGVLLLCFSCPSHHPHPSSARSEQTCIWNVALVVDSCSISLVGMGGEPCACLRVDRLSRPVCVLGSIEIGHWYRTGQVAFE